MSEIFVPRVGAVFSADIAVPEHERELRFYSRVLTTGENPLWREDLMSNLGMPIIGVGARSADYAELPIQWMPHIQVDDVAASAQRSLDLGGRVLMQAGGDDGKCHWAVLVDPNGAAFGIVPVVPAAQIPTSASRGAAEAVGRIYWLDLTVDNATATRDFYRQVVGWSVENVDIENGGERYVDYNMVGSDGKPAAGVCHARGVNADLPPVWMIYLTVADLGASLDRVQAEGGRIIKAMQGKNGEYLYAAIQDPVGAYLSLVPGGA